MSSIAMAADSTQSLREERKFEKKKKRSSDPKKKKKQKKTSLKKAKHRSHHHHHHQHQQAAEERRRKGGGDSEDDDEVTSDHEQDLDLSFPLKPVSGYVNDRDEMLHHMFRSISTAKLKAMLPEILRPIPIDELKALCEEQLEYMSKKRIRRILSGADPETISSSGTEDESSELEEEEEEEEGPEGDEASPGGGVGEEEGAIPRGESPQAEAAPTENILEEEGYQPEETASADVSDEAVKVTQQEGELADPGGPPDEEQTPEQEDEEGRRDSEGHTQDSSESSDTSSDSWSSRASSPASVSEEESPQSPSPLQEGTSKVEKPKKMRLKPVEWSEEEDGEIRSEEEVTDSEAEETNAPGDEKAPPPDSIVVADAERPRRRTVMVPSLEPMADEAEVSEESDEAEEEEEGGADRSHSTWRASCPEVLLKESEDEAELDTIEEKEVSFLGAIEDKEKSIPTAPRQDGQEGRTVSDPEVVKDGDNREMSAQDDADGVKEDVLAPEEGQTGEKEATDTLEAEQISSDVKGASDSTGQAKASPGATKTSDSELQSETVAVVGATDQSVAQADKDSSDQSAEHPPIHSSDSREESTVTHASIAGIVEDTLADAEAVVEIPEETLTGSITDDEDVSTSKPAEVERKERNARNDDVELIPAVSSVRETGSDDVEASSQSSCPLIEIRVDEVKFDIDSDLAPNKSVKSKTSSKASASAPTKSKSKSKKEKPSSRRKAIIEADRVSESSDDGISVSIQGVCITVGQEGNLNRIKYTSETAAKIASDSSKPKAESKVGASSLENKSSESSKVAQKSTKTPPVESSSQAEEMDVKQVSTAVRKPTRKIKIPPSKQSQQAPVPKVPAKNDKRIIHTTQGPSKQNSTTHDTVTDMKISIPNRGDKRIIQVAAKRKSTESSEEGVGAVPVKRHVQVPARSVEKAAGALKRTSIEGTAESSPPKKTAVTHRAATKTMTSASRAVTSSSLESSASSKTQRSLSTGGAVKSAPVTPGPGRARTSVAPKPSPPKTREEMALDILDKELGELNVKPPRVDKPSITQSQMEILELEMRARAIKAMLKTQEAKELEPSKAPAKQVASAVSSEESNKTARPKASSVGTSRTAKPSTTSKSKHKPKVTPKSVAVVATKHVDVPPPRASSTPKQKKSRFSQADPPRSPIGSSSPREHRKHSPRSVTPKSVVAKKPATSPGSSKSKSASQSSSSIQQKLLQMASYPVDDPRSQGAKPRDEKRRKSRFSSP